MRLKCLYIHNFNSNFFQVMIVDDLGYISGSGAVIGQNVILTSAQHFEG